ncbi:MAG: proton-conducting transporter membrane subunit [Gammaproteobacteria bacterium]
MTETPLAYLLLPVLVWPLLLAAAASFRATRPLALRLTPWAALPALAAVAIPNTELQFSGVMLGGALALDAIGRVFLLSMSALWLASGLLARRRLHASDSGPFAVLLLLAMAGGLGMALVGDALWFFAASTLAGYALYGVLMQAGDGTTRQAGKLLVIFLVASDLLVFEVLLMLAHSAAGSDFASFRQAFVSAESRTLILGLLVVGFGIKIGLLGVHFWLAPVFTTAAAPLRPALVAYMLGAGLLGGLRLLPIGELNAPVAGDVLRWLAWATLVYAWLVGTLQLQRRSTLAYAAMALGGLWLAVLSAFLHHPGLWTGSATSPASMLVQSGLALAVLLLTATAVEGKQSPTTVQFVFGLRWLAASLLATAPVGIAGVLTVQAAGLPIHLATAVIAFLAGVSLLRREGGAAVVPADMSARTGTGRNASLDMPMSSVLVPATGLAVAAAFALVYQSTGWSFYDAAVSASIALASLLLGASSARWLVPHLPSLPPGDAVVFIAYAIAAARAAGRRLSECREYLSCTGSPR